MVPMVPVLRYCGGGGEDYNFLFHFLLPGRVIVTFVINSIILILLIPTPCALCTLNVRLLLLLLLPVIDFFFFPILFLFFHYSLVTYPPTTIRRLLAAALQSESYPRWCVLRVE